jgi:hypothetical protein
VPTATTFTTAFIGAEAHIDPTHLVACVVPCHVRDAPVIEKASAAVVAIALAVATASAGDPTATLPAAGADTTASSKLIAPTA